MAMRARTYFDEIYDINAVADTLIEDLSPMIEARRMGSSTP
jgi:hypothetical protein